MDFHSIDIGILFYFVWAIYLASLGILGGCAKNLGMDPCHGIRWFLVLQSRPFMRHDERDPGESDDWRMSPLWWTMAGWWGRWFEERRCDLRRGWGKPRISIEVRKGIGICASCSEGRWLIEYVCSDVCPQDSPPLCSESCECGVAPNPAKFQCDLGTEIMLQLAMKLIQGHCARLPPTCRNQGLSLVSRFTLARPQVEYLP